MEAYSIMKIQKYGFVYIWWDKKKNRYYIGSHWGTSDDGYVCSSWWMKRSYTNRPTDFCRKILYKTTDRPTLLVEEEKWLHLIKDEELGKKYYNLNNKGVGHWCGNKEKHATITEKLRKKAKEQHNDPVFRAKYLEGLKKRNKHQSKETIEKRRKSLTGNRRSEEEKVITRESFSRGKNHGNYGKPLAPERIKKISEHTTGKKNPFFGKTHTKETRKANGEKISKALKGRIPKNIDIFRGSYWWNDGEKNKRSVECPGESWTKGMMVEKE